jgi:hypothetical protein
LLETPRLLGTLALLDSTLRDRPKSPTATSSGHLLLSALPLSSMLEGWRLL